MRDTKSIAFDDLAFAFRTNNQSGGHKTENGIATHPDLICPACLCEIPHPFDALIITLLKDFEETNNQARRSEHQDLKIDINGWASPDLPMRGTG